MARKRKLRFRNLFLVIFVSYLVVLLLPLVMTGTIYFRSETVVKEQIIDSNQAMLKQMKKTIDDRLDEIEKLSSQIFLDQNTQSLMNTSGALSDAKRLKMVSLLKSYSSYKNITPFIDDFMVYFYNLDYLMTSSKACSPRTYFNYFIQSDQSYESWKQENFLSSHRSGITAHTVLDFKSGESMLCFWTSLLGTAGDVPLGNICIMVREESFEELLSSVEEISGGMAFALDEKGRVIFASPAAEREALPDLSQCTGNGEKVFPMGEQDYVFAYIDSAESGLKYVTAFPEDVLQAKIEYMRQFSQLMLYICAAAALMLILGLTYSNYRPIRDIARQFDGDAEAAEMGAYQYIDHSVQQITRKNRQFQQVLEKHEPLFRANFLRKLISGAVTDPDEISSALESYGIPFSEEADFAVLLIHIEDSSQFMKDNSEKEQNFVRLILQNIGEELAEAAGVGCMTEIEETFCLILNLQTAAQGEAKKAALAVAEEIKKEVERYFGIVMTIAVGGNFGGFRGIWQSYLEACRALDYRLIRGIGTVICADDLKQASSNYYYPTEMEGYLMNFVRSGDYAQAENLLNRLFDENFKTRTLSPSIGKCFFFDMISTAVKLLDSMNTESELVFPDSNPVEELLECGTVGEMQQKLLEIFRQLCEYVNNNKKSHNHQLREEILQYIQKNYADENLSQTMIANHFDISSNYLSNFFHEQTGEKMSAYIARQRVERAKVLLRETDGNMNTIAAAVGFGSDLTLLRVFKKLEGLTPGQYRTQNRKKG
ncbi:MAG: AraC family transcriptional regulator [Provencibacterium sp.]|jgi:two-component system response regulator YesN|nr:AraC family transcriptional regulator [Provencibacterium sp.]